jgi:hypothetical protein
MPDAPVPDLDGKATPEGHQPDERGESSMKESEQIPWTISEEPPPPDDQAADGHTEDQDEVEGSAK